MGFYFSYDPELDVVNFEGEGRALDLDEVERLLAWLRSTTRFMRHKRELREGGRRWVFRRGGPKSPPTARRFRGKVAWSTEFELFPITPRKGTRCDSCNGVKQAGLQMWRQAPGSWAGQSRARFCSGCVDRGGPPRPPSLRIISGGADAQDVKSCEGDGS